MKHAENSNEPRHELEVKIESLKLELADLATTARAAASQSMPSGTAQTGIEHTGSTASTTSEPSDTGSKAMRNFIALNALAVCRSNIEGIVFEANEAFCELLGWTKADIAAKKVGWIDITPTKYHNVLPQKVKDLIVNGKTEAFEKEYIHKDGRVVPVMVAILALDATGKDWLAFILDLSEQKKAERQLKVSESQFRHLSESIPQIVWLADSHMNLIYANHRLYDYSGKSAAELNGDQWLQLVHRDDVDDWKKSASYSNVYEMEVRYRHHSGEYKWFLARTSPVLNDNKEVLMWVGTSTDIDEQKHNEDDLKESELQYRTLADAIPQIVWTAPPEGEIDFFNHRWFEYTGLTWSQSVDQGWTLLIHPDDRKHYLSEWQKALKTGDTYEQEFRLRRAIGVSSTTELRYRWHLSRAVALRNEDGSIQKWFATWTEIEDQKSKRH